MNETNNQCVVSCCFKQFDNLLISIFNLHTLFNLYITNNVTDYITEIIQDPFVILTVHKRK